MTEVSASQKSFPKKLKILLPLMLLGVVGFVVIPRVFRSEPEPGLQVSGRIEGYETDVGAKVGGRVEMIAVREGDVVKKGQAIAQLEDTELQAALNGASARITAAQQQANQAALQLTVIENQIEEAQLTQLQAEDDTVGRVNSAKSTVSAAEAQLAQAKAQEKQLVTELLLAKSDRDRFKELFDSGVVSEQQFEQAQTKYDAMQETLQARKAFSTAAQEQVATAKGNLTQSQASQLNPEIRAVQVQRLYTQLEQAQAQLSSAQAAVSSAQASYAEIKARFDDLEILSPIDGVVLSRTVEPGEVISTGKTVLTLVNLEDVFMRGYIPEAQVGAIRIGQAAEVFLDSAPEDPLAATVAAIDTEASFTPENIYFRDDRVTQVFGLKLSIENGENFAKPGMPADANILTETVKN